MGVFIETKSKEQKDETPKSIRGQVIEELKKEAPDD